MAGTPHNNPKSNRKSTKRHCAHKQYTDKFKQKIVDKYKFQKSYNPRLTVTDFAESVKIKYTTVNPWIKKQKDLDKSLENQTARIPEGFIPLSGRNTENSTSLDQTSPTPSSQNPTTQNPTSPNPTSNYPGSYKDAFRRFSNYKKQKEALDPDVEQRLYDWFLAKKKTDPPDVFFFGPFFFSKKLEKSCFC